MAGTLIISLDFELGWGHRVARPSYIEKLRKHEQYISKRFKRLVQLLDFYGIPATWAVVGKLLEDGEDRLFHRPELLSHIVNAQTDHEVGLHSYSHRPFDDLSEEEAHNDLKLCMELLTSYDIEPVSFVFPQNRIDHRDVIAKYGMLCYRDELEGNIVSNSIRKIAPPTVESSIEPSGLMALPGSMFIAAKRPIRILYWQAIFAILRASVTKSTVHFWLHPHNIVVRPSLLGMLERIFSLICGYRQNDELQIRTMSDVGAVQMDKHHG